MSTRPSTRLQDHFQLRLPASWCRWFDDAVYSDVAIGEFRNANTVEDLVVDTPCAVWPGFMMPDTLPLVGNEYGDWLCVRVTNYGQLGELIHWYHGGGDWIPVGRNPAEALLHDAVDQFRKATPQSLRGAAESGSRNPLELVLERMVQPSVSQWYASELAEASTSVDNVEQVLQQIHAALSGGDYRQALYLLQERGWAFEATHCDLIAVALEHPLLVIARPEVANRHGAKWEPDMLRWMFDPAQIPPPIKSALLREAGLEEEAIAEQDWPTAAQLAKSVRLRRQDLAWANDIAGWAEERAGNRDTALAIYRQGRLCSSFSDQSVRLRTHWYRDHFGKFAIDRYHAVAEFRSASELDDEYLQVVLDNNGADIRKRVYDFWLHKANRAFQSQNYPQALDYYRRAAWDIGPPTLNDYRQILTALVETAERGKLFALARVAEMHLRCFVSRYS